MMTAMSHLDQADGVPEGGGPTLGAVLDQSLPDAVVLRNRHKPGRRTIIDYIVIARSGVWVIDAKLRTGRVELRADRSTDAGVELLYVDGHDRSRDVDAMSLHYEVVARAISTTELADVPIIPLLCYPRADWRGFSEAPEVCRIRVCWPREVARVVDSAPLVIDFDQVQSVAAELDARLVVADPDIVGPPR